MALASGYVQGCCDFSPEQVRPNSGFFSIKEQTENDDQIQYMYVKEEKFFWIAQNWQRKKKSLKKYSGAVAKVSFMFPGKRLMRHKLNGKLESFMVKKSICFEITTAYMHRTG